MIRMMITVTKTDDMIYRPRALCTGSSASVLALNVSALLTLPFIWDTRCHYRTRIEHLFDQGTDTLARIRASLVSMRADVVLQ